MEATKRGRLLKPAEVAQALGVSRRTVWDLLERGDLPRIKIAKRATRIAEADLDAFIASRRAVSAT
jgi:excisionase family DNA binding protein